LERRYRDEHVLAQSLFKKNDEQKRIITQLTAERDKARESTEEWKVKHARLEKQCESRLATMKEVSVMMRKLHVCAFQVVWILGCFF
jgi:Na+-translocating ferredoxin:NAD+ oxidoreductase RnfC subunit